MLICCLFVIHIILIFNGNVIGKKNPGDACIPSGTEDDQGICTVVSSCPKVLNDIRNGERFPVICGYEDLTQIVCCPKESESSKNLPSDMTSVKSRISEQKCKEYKKTTYEYVLNFNKMTNQMSTRAIQSCILESDVPVLNKEPAVLREFPHMAILGYVTSTNITRWRCSGILISDEFVLTTGYCAKQDAHYVKLGELILNDDSDGAKPIDIRITEKITHPKYMKKNKYNDIALLRLAEKVQFNSFVRPACLPTNANLNAINRPIATGWINEVLYRATLKIKSNNDCNRKYKFVGGGLDERQFCAVPQVYDENACQSISDGMLQMHHISESCMYTIIGIPTLIQLCGIHTYTSVFSYLDWIEGIVWSND